MNQPVETRPLTPAQKAYVRTLNERATAAQAALNEYVDEYLRMELGTPMAEGWELRDLNIGFVKRPREEEGPLHDTQDSNAPGA